MMSNVAYDHGEEEEEDYDEEDDEEEEDDEDADIVDTCAFAEEDVTVPLPGHHHHDSSPHQDQTMPSETVDAVESHQFSSSPRRPIVDSYGRYLTDATSAVTTTQTMPQQYSYEQEAAQEAPVPYAAEVRQSPESQVNVPFNDYVASSAAPHSPRPPTTLLSSSPAQQRKPPPSAQQQRYYRGRGNSVSSPTSTSDPMRVSDAWNSESGSGHHPLVSQQSSTALKSPVAPPRAAVAMIRHQSSSSSVGLVSFPHACTGMENFPPETPREIVTALREGSARGLPAGWTCVIDVSPILFDARWLLVSLPYTLFVILVTWTHISVRNEIVANGRHLMAVAVVIRFPRPWLYPSKLACCLRTRSSLLAPTKRPRNS
jgi:hypothetical protein